MDKDRDIQPVCHMRGCYGPQPRDILAPPKRENKDVSPASHCARRKREREWGEKTTKRRNSAIPSGMPSAHLPLHSLRHRHRNQRLLLISAQGRNRCLVYLTFSREGCLCQGGIEQRASYRLYTPLRQQLPRQLSRRHHQRPIPHHSSGWAASTYKTRDVRVV